MRVFGVGAPLKRFHRQRVAILVWACALLLPAVTSAQSSLSMIEQGIARLRGLEGVAGASSLASALSTVHADPSLLAAPDVQALLAASGTEGFSWQHYDDVPGILPELVETLAAEAMVDRVTAALQTPVGTSSTPGKRLIGACPMAPAAPELCGGVTLAADVSEIAAAVSRQGRTRLPKIPGVGVTRSVEDAAAAHEELAQEALTRLKACGRDRSCIEQAVGELTSESRFRKLFSGTCIGRHAAALSNLAYQYALALSAVGLSYAASDTDEFPYGYLVSSITLTAFWSEIACRAHLEGPANIPEAEAAGFFKRFARSYWTYTKAIPVEVGMLVGTQWVEDAIRGKDVTSREYLEERLRQGVFIMVWDLGIANARSILIMNPLNLRVWPGANRAVTNLFQQGWLGKLVSLNGRAVIVQRVPGAVTEFVGRAAVRAFNTYLFLNVMDYVEDPDNPLPLIGGPDNKAGPPPG